MSDASVITTPSGKRGVIAPISRPSVYLHLFKAAAAPESVPASGDVTGGITSWGMLGNGPDPSNPPSIADGVGDCVVAAVEHGRMSKAAPGEPNPAVTTELTLSRYYAFGVAQGEPTTDGAPGPDQGCEPTSYLSWLFAQGAIDAWAELAPKADGTYDAASVHQAMLDFRGVLLCVNLTPDAEQDFEAQPKIAWTVSPTDQPDPNEGHGIWLVAYDENGEQVVTWGGLQPVSLDWESSSAISGAYVIVTDEDAARAGMTADQLAALKAECTALGGEASSSTPPSPDVPPTPDVTPPEPVDPPAPETLEELIMRRLRGLAEHHNLSGFVVDLMSAIREIVDALEKHSPAAAEADAEEGVELADVVDELAGDQSA